MANKWPRRPDVLARWSRVAIPVKTPAADAEHRDRLVGAIARAMDRAVAERSARRPAAWRAALAAVAIVLLAVAGTWRERTAIGRFVASGRALLAVSHEVAVVASLPRDPSQLRLPSGVILATGPETRLRASDPMAPSSAREEVVVDLGLLRVEVPKLPPGHTFAVRTPDALVTVHGTSFSVEVTRSGPGEVTTTKVVVTHGVVSVVSVLHPGLETLLYPGMEWSSPREVVAATVATPPESGGAAIAPPRLTQRAPEERAGASRPRRRRDAGRSSQTALGDRSRSAPAAPPREVDSTPGSVTEKVDLAGQNDLFAEAKRARIAGDQHRALGLLSDLVRRFPTSPLAEDAHVEMFRALAQEGDRVGAAREAQRYLALYADGFARGEARRLAQQPGSDP